MKRPHRDATSISLLVFGGYALIMGLVLLLAPEQLLPSFGFAESSGTWVHVLGFVLCCSAYYYLWAGWSGNKAFARLTVHTRFAAPLVMLALMMMGKVDHMVLVFGIVDAAGGAWTAATLWLGGKPRSTKQDGNN
ncbi:MAG: hypothetical protein JNL05_14065 [Flavobacteriales bacterium]|nr:hypothetical protein [Flavobacteriales bacterium]